jgi:hypothetical protein
VNGAYGVLDSQSKERVANIRGGTDRYVADKNESSRNYVADQGLAGRKVTADAKTGESSNDEKAAQSDKAAAFSRGGVAPKFSIKEGVTAKNLNNDFASTLNEISTFLPDMVVTSADRKAGEAGKLGANSLHPDGRAADLRVTPQTTAFIKSEFGRDYFAKKGVTVVEETSKEAMAKYGSTGPHYHLEYKGNAQPSAQPSASQMQPSGYVATRIKSLTEKIPATEQADFEKYLETLPPEKKRVLQFQGKEINADQKIGEIVNGYIAQRGKVAQPATQAPTTPQSTAPAMPQQAAAVIPQKLVPPVEGMYQTIPTEVINKLKSMPTAQLEQILQATQGKDIAMPLNSSIYSELTNRKNSASGLGVIPSAAQSIGKYFDNRTKQQQEFAAQSAAQSILGTK